MNQSFFAIIAAMIILMIGYLFLSSRPATSPSVPSSQQNYQAP